MPAPARTDWFASCMLLRPPQTRKLPMKSLILAPLAAGAVLLCGVLHSFDASASPTLLPPGPARTLDLSIVPKTINEPGLYVVDRNWDLRKLGTDPSSATTTLTIMANNVVIELNGHQLRFGEYGIGVKIKGSNVTLHDG